jgi:hypothetical protein
VSYPSQGVAVIVVGDPMRKLRPGERIDLQDIVKKLDELKSIRPDLADSVRLLNRIEVIANVVHTAA